MRYSHILLLTGTILALSATGLATAASRKLPASGADPARTSVSGLSSGGFMAIQYGVAFSASTVGLGVVAGGPYNCALVNARGTDTCMSGKPDGAASYGAAQRFAALGQIDPVNNLAAQKIYLFSGTNDSTVKQTVMDAALDFFHAAHVTGASIQYVKQIPAGHAFIAPSFGNSCGATATPYVDQCAEPGQSAPGGKYDQANAILTQIYGTLKPVPATLSSEPVEFDQTEFLPPLKAAMSSMADRGFVYIPAACSNTGSAPCAVHVVFHGCKQGAETVRDAVYAKVGYSNWADSNNIIVLYPQAAVSSFIPFNPEGCWDWWGYSGLDFQVRTGAQLAAVRAMVDRLTTSRK